MIKQGAAQVSQVGGNDGTLSDHVQKRHGAQQKAVGMPASGNMRHVRMSARPQGERRTADDLMSPKENDRKLAQRRSPMPQQSQSIANEMSNEMLMTKNFNLAKNDQSRLRNAQTFVGRQGHNHTRSVISNSDKILIAHPDNDLGAQSMIVPGNKARGQARLQALAELRQRENNTVQAGQQLLLGRQRSREGYLETQRKKSGMAKSTHDRCDEPPATDRPSLRQPHIIKQRGSSRRDSSVEPYQLPYINHPTENDGSMAGDLVTHMYNKSHNFERTLGSVERDFTAEDDDGAADDEKEQVDDVLSKSQSSDENEDLEGYDNDGEDEQLSGDYYDEEEEDLYGEEEQLSADEGADGEDYATEDDDQEGYVDGDRSNYSNSQDSDTYNTLSRRRGKIPVASTKILKQGLPPRRIQNQNAPSGEQIISSVNRPAAHQRNDSQRRAYQGSGRQKSPFDQKSQYSERKNNRSNLQKHQQHRSTKAEHANGKHMRNVQGSQSKAAYAKKRQVLNPSSRSTQDIHMDRNMKAQFSVSRATRKRNQPLKININMTGGSGSGQPVRQDTAQSMNSMQGMAHYQPHQQHLALMQSNFMYAHSQPNLTPAQVHQQAAALPLYYRPPAQVDHQLQQYMLQQQTNQAMLNHMQNPSQSSYALSPPFNQFTGQPQLLQQQMNLPSQITSPNQSIIPAQVVAQVNNTQQPNKAPMPPFEASNRNTLRRANADISQPRSPLINPSSGQTKESLPDTLIPWLNSTSKTSTETEVIQKQSPKDLGSQGNVVAKKHEVIADDEDEMEELWRRLREKDLAKKKTEATEQTKSRLKEEKVVSVGRRRLGAGESQNSYYDLPQLPTSSKGTKSDKTQAEEEEENFIVTKRKTKAEAMMIGFDSNAIASNQWAKKPKLGAKRQAKQTQGQGENPAIRQSSSNQVSENQKPEEIPENVLPLGADFKKVSLEQIKARDERLKKIKDQGLIEIALDEQPDVSGQVNLAEAFAAKRKARLGDAQPLDQDLAVARDVSSNARLPQKKEKAQKTPQELAAIRKAMMRKKSSAVSEPAVVDSKPVVLKSVTPSTMIESGGASVKTRPSISGTQRPGTAKEPSQALMERLALGKRTTIDKKEMKKLTKINYENLPEIKRRKDEERKRQEALEKKERVAKYNKECKARSRAQLKKKRGAATSTAVQGTDQTEENQACLVAGPAKK